jgi:hypothetical protein
LWDDLVRFNAHILDIDTRRFGGAAADTQNALIEARDSLMTMRDRFICVALEKSSVVSSTGQIHLVNVCARHAGVVNPASTA